MTRWIVRRWVLGREKQFLCHFGAKENDGIVYFYFIVLTSLDLSVVRQEQKLPIHRVEIKKQKGPDVTLIDSWMPIAACGLLEVCLLSDEQRLCMGQTNAPY